MRTAYALLGVLFILIFGIAFYLTSPNLNYSMANLSLTSPAFEPAGSIPSQYTCDGENILPPLEISGVGEDAQSLVLIMEDPDVPRDLRPDGMYDHWVKFNIPPNITSIPEGTEPEGVSGSGTNGSLSFFGPCPPDREHRYFFKLFALDTLLDIPEGSSKQEVLSAMNGHILDQTELMGVYDRKR